jgi:hypothetical protein
MLAVSAARCRSEQDLPVHTYMLVVPVISDLHPLVVTYASRRIRPFQKDMRERGHHHPDRSSSKQVVCVLVLVLVDGDSTHSVFSCVDEHSTDQSCSTNILYLLRPTWSSIRYDDGGDRSFLGWAVPQWAPPSNGVVAMAWRVIISIASRSTVTLHTFGKGKAHGPIPSPVLASYSEASIPCTVCFSSIHIYPRHQTGLYERVLISKRIRFQ